VGSILRRSASGVVMLAAARLSLARQYGQNQSPLAMPAAIASAQAASTRQHGRAPRPAL